MPPVDRLHPIRAASSESSYSLMEFMREFPDDAACLNWLWRTRHSEDGTHADCPRCGVERAFKRYETSVRRQSWTCTTCGHHLHPTAGTIFHKSSTSLHLWFFAMYLMTSTRCGISAKQLERELGVTYKTAWRMFNKIRNELMVEDDEPLSGEVEADETFVGGKLRNSHRREREALGWDRKMYDANRKTIVFAAVERQGRVRARIISDSGGIALRDSVSTFVMPSSILFTDEWRGYDAVGRKYVHRRIRHRDRIYVEGTTHTQTVEGFFSMFKNGVRGVYHSVSRKWLQGYLNEYAWRYNRRDNGRAMFLDLLNEAATRTR